MATSSTPATQKNMPRTTETPPETRNSPARKGDDDSERYSGSSSPGGGDKHGVHRDDDNGEVDERRAVDVDENKVRPPETRPDGEVEYFLGDDIMEDENFEMDHNKSSTGFEGLSTEDAASPLDREKLVTGRTSGNRMEE